MTVVDGTTGREEKYTYNTDPLKLMPLSNSVNGPVKSPLKILHSMVKFSEAL